MNDIDISTSTRKMSPPKQGRRAASNLNDYGIDDITIPDDLLSPIGSPVESPLHRKVPPSGPPRRRRSEGWAPNSMTSSEIVSKMNEEKFRRFDDEDDDDIPVIPDLEEIVESDLSQQIAQAPSVSVNRVATIKELDSDLLQHAAFNTLEDVDLKILTRVLFNESEVKEIDVEWTWDTLFTEVSSDLLNDSLANEDGDGNEFNKLNTAAAL